MNKFNFISLLHRLYQLDMFVYDLFTAIAFVVNNIFNAITTLKGEFYFDTMIIMVPVYEALMKIIPASTQTLNNRRSAIQAKWLSNNKCDLALIQAVANCWQNGNVNVTFTPRYLTVNDINNMTVNELDQQLISNFASGNDQQYSAINIEFVNIIGVPGDINTLKNMLSAVVPAHIPLSFLYKYLPVSKVNNMTVNELNQQLISNFAY